MRNVERDDALAKRAKPQQGLFQRTARTLLRAGLLAGLSGCRGGDWDVEYVFLITCDTLRADRLGLYGYARQVSPRLDAFAAGALVFDEAYACAPMTQPAVSSLLAGRLPTELGAVPGNRRLMPPEVETLPEMLAEHGIETAAVVSNYVLQKLPQMSAFGVSQGFAHFDDRLPDRESSRGLEERTAAHTTDAALEWLAGHFARGGERCFLWVHYQDPHGPYTPPEDHARLFDGELGQERVPLGADKLGHRQIPNYQQLDGSQQADLYRNRYDAEIHYFDAQVGRLLDWLEARGLLERALVIFSADHGEALGEHDYWFCHGESLYRETVRVPFVVRTPAGVALGAGRPGARTDLPVSHLDVLPTVLEAFGLSVPRGIPGRSLLGKGPPPERILTQVLLPSDKRTKWLAASDGRYRLVWNEADGVKRLYDVRADPGEERDVASQHPERVAALWEVIGAAIASQESIEGADIELDEKVRAALEALGYGGG